VELFGLDENANGSVNSTPKREAGAEGEPDAGRHPTPPDERHERRIVHEPARLGLPGTRGRLQPERAAERAHPVRPRLIERRQLCDGTT
jgi:hypothetical protein